jgi:hypothetical protein
MKCGYNATLDGCNLNGVRTQMQPKQAVFSYIKIVSRSRPKNRKEGMTLRHLPLNVVAVQGAHLVCFG